MVVGAGNDSALYVTANHGGRTAVLESDSSWIERIRDLDCEVIPVEYTTRVADGVIDPCPLPTGVDERVLDTEWDVILVDGPTGFSPDCPGRRQSIHLAAQLLRPQTTIFVHDTDRPLEDACVTQDLPPSVETITGPRELRIFRL